MTDAHKMGNQGRENVPHEMLEAEIARLRALLKDAEEMLSAVVGDPSEPDDGTTVSSIKVDIPRDGYPRQWLRHAARHWLEGLGKQP